MGAVCAGVPPLPEQRASASNDSPGACFDANKEGEPDKHPLIKICDKSLRHRIGPRQRDLNTTQTSVGLFRRRDHDGHCKKGSYISQQQGFRRSGVFLART
jgi:hypothetical protein